MDYVLSLLTDPNAWAAFAALTAMEVVLGIDNLVFISILSNKLPEEKRALARRVGISAALILRLFLLGTIAFIIGLTEPVVTLFEHSLSWRDIILITGGVFLLWKATKEIHHIIDPDPEPENNGIAAVGISFSAVVVQILLLDIVFSIDSIITAVGMTEHLPIMVAAVIITVTAMLVAADPLSRFIHANPTVVMLALGFLLLIGTTLIAEGFGAHLPKGYIYAAMAFAVIIESLNMLSRRAKRKRIAQSSTD
ncbi:TerC family protein [Thalassotalea fusca]